MGYFVHPMGLCETKSVGDGTRVWAFAHILPSAIIGRDCNICDHVFIENKVVLGDRVTVKCGVQLWDNITVEDDVFIGPNATFTNDPFPRSKQYLADAPKTVIRKGASIGAGATILPGITIGQNAMIGAGSVVTSNVQPNAVVTGNPARVVDYVDAVRPAPGRADHMGPSGASSGPAETTVRGVSVYRLKLVEDMRGNLTVGEFNREIPFVPKRYFTIFDVPGSRVRGEHALRDCDQFLVCLKGRCSVVVDDGNHREELILDSPELGIYLPSMIWSTLYKFSGDAVLLVFASSFYNEIDYIRDYQEYLALMSSPAGSTSAKT